MLENMYAAIVFSSMLQDPTSKNLAKHKQIDSVSGLYKERRKQRVRETECFSYLGGKRRDEGNAFKFTRTLDSYPLVS